MWSLITDDDEESDGDDSDNDDTTIRAQVPQSTPKEEDQNSKSSGFVYDC